MRKTTNISDTRLAAYAEAYSLARAQIQESERNLAVAANKLSTYLSSLLEPGDTLLVQWVGGTKYREYFLDSVDAARAGVSLRVHSAGGMKRSISAIDQAGHLFPACQGVRVWSKALKLK